METKKAYKSFRYESTIRWNGGRKGAASSPGKPDLEVSSPPEFKGDAGYWTPEDMLVASLNTCIMETFLAFAQGKGLELASYQSTADALLEHRDGKYRFTEITVKPVVTLKSSGDEARAREMMESAHANCFISNSIIAAVKVVPEIRFQ